MSDETRTVSIRVASLRQMPHPYPQDEPTPVDGCTYYLAICDAQELPQLLSLKPNLREQKVTTKVAKRIRDGLIEDNGALGFFHLANRGIVVSAEKASFDNRSGALTLYMPDDDVHGILDGGHTYKIILENRDKLLMRQFVKIEVIAGVTSEVLHYIAQARNTSVQVSQRAIYEHEGAYDVIKKALTGQAYAKNIRYKDNAPGDIDIQDIICMMTPFNRRLCPPGATTQPSYIYSNKERCLEAYYEEFKAGFPHVGGYQDAAALLPDILDLHDTIHKLMPDMYNKHAGEGGSGGKYGKRREIMYNEGKEIHKLHFLREKIAYGTPKGLIYPILAAHRIILQADESTGRPRWRSKIGTPTRFFRYVGHHLVKTIMDQSQGVGQNPQTVGKSGPIWEAVLNVAQLQMMARYKEFPELG